MSRPKKNKRSLVTIGEEANFPAITLNDTEEYDNHQQSKAGKYIETRAGQIREDFDDLKQIAQDTDMINKLDKRYEPKTGVSYHLYESEKSGQFLSFIEPEEWTPSTRPDTYVGSFKLTPDGTWVRPTISNGKGNTRPDISWRKLDEN